MKTNKIYLVIFMLILYLSFLLQGTTINSNLQDKKNNKNVVFPLTASNALICAWNRTLGGTDQDGAYEVAVDSSGNVYLAGYTYSFGAGSADMVLVKYDGNGMQQWNRTWGGSNYDEGIGVAVDSLDNVYLAGSTNSYEAGVPDMVLVKYNGNGLQQWNHTWSGFYIEHCHGVIVDSSGNIYLTGDTSFGAGGADMILVKYDGNGMQQWNRTWGGSNDDIGFGVAVDLSGNVYVVGYTRSFGAGYLADMILVKYDSSGVQQWNRTWGGSNSDYGYGVAVDSSGNVYLAGTTFSFGAGSADMVLIKYDGKGIQQWNRTWGGDIGDSGYGVAVDSSGKVYLAGYTGSFGAGNVDMALVKYDGNGVQQWNRTWGGIGSDWGRGVAVDSLDNVYLVGSTRSFGVGDYDMVLVKYGIAERPPSDEFIMILIIVVSIASAVGVGISIIYFIRKRRKIVE